MDRDPKRPFFAYRDSRGFFGSWCKKCMRGALVGSATRYNDTRRTFILQCPSCKKTDQMRMSSDDMESDRKVCEAFRKIEGHIINVW
jgi:hypothetical protein